MKAVDIIKMVGNVVTGLGVGKTVDLVLKNNLPIDMNWRTRIATFIGSAAISGYISAKCSEYVEEEIDQVANIVEKVKEGKDFKAILDNEEIAEKITEDDNSVVNIMNVSI